MENLTGFKFRNLSPTEAINVNGGRLHPVLLWFVIESALNYDDAIDAFKAGWEDASQ